MCIYKLIDKWIDTQRRNVFNSRLSQLALAIPLVIIMQKPGCMCATLAKNSKCLLHKVMNVIVAHAYATPHHDGVHLIQNDRIHRGHYSHFCRFLSLSLSLSVSLSLPLAR